MAYNYFPAGYQPAQIVYPQASQLTPQQPVQQNNQMMQPTTDIKWVQGEAGAKSYMVAPNTSVTLWDSESQTIYIKSANASGLPTMTVIDYTIRDNTPQVKQDLPVGDFATKEDVDILKKEIESLRAKLGEHETDGKEKK